MSATILEKLRGIEPETETTKPEAKKAPETPPEKKESAIEPEAGNEEPEKKDDVVLAPDVVSEALWPGRKAIKEKKADEKKAEKQAGADDKAEKKPKGEKKPKVIVEEEEDADDRLSSVERAFERGVEAASKIAPKREEQRPTIEPEPDVELDEDDEFELSVYKQVEKDDPKFKGVTAQYKKGLKQWSEYAEKWAEENPDKEWNPDDPEHEATYAKLMPKVPARAYEVAKAKLAVEPVVEERTKKLREENLELRKKTLVTELAPVIEKTSDEITTAVAAAIGDDVAEAVKSPESIKKLAEEDPVAFDILRQQANAARVLNHELVLITRDPQTFRVDAKNNPVHSVLVNIVRDLESDYSKMPKRQTAWKGRQFATHVEFSKMSAEEQARHWVVGENEIRQRIGEVLADEAKTAYDNQMALISKYGGARKSSQGKSKAESEEGDSAAGNTDQEEEDEAPKPKISRDKVGSIEKKDKSSPGDFSGKLRSALWSR